MLRIPVESRASRTASAWVEVDLGLGDYVRWGPLGERIAVIEDGAVFVMNADGESMVRQIDPSTHREDAEREYQQRVAELLQLEEEALADEPLPASRRQQVLQYLTTLRRQLVDQQSDE